MHPLDTLDRKQQAQEDHGLGYCNITKCCTEVCPEGIHITDNGIIPMKERVVDTKYDPAFGLFRVLRARSKSTKRMNEHAERRGRCCDPSRMGACRLRHRRGSNVQLEQAEAMAHCQHRIRLGQSRGAGPLRGRRLEESASAPRASRSRGNATTYEQSDAWVTLARVDLVNGNRAAAAHAIDQARQQWPDNPRLSLVETVVS